MVGGEKWPAAFGDLDRKFHCANDRQSQSWRTMKSLAMTVARRLWPVPRFAVTVIFLASFSPWSVAQVTDTNLRLTLTRANQDVVLGWFGSNAVSYQVEASASLPAWTNLSSVLTGSSAFLFVTNPLAGVPQRFFRVKRLEVISASFDSLSGILSIIGDDLDNVIVVSRNAAGALLINNGAVAIQGGVPTVANTVLIQIFGRGGNDQLALDEANGALPKANLFGEAGDDMLTGGSGADVLTGGPGNDTLLGKGGSDSLLGGDDNDTVTGGDGDDVAQLGSGNDRFIWNPGDDTDIVEGGDGVDTAEVNGGNGAEDFTITANGTRVRFDRINPAPFLLDLGTCENLVLNANGGNDTLSCSGNLAALIQITADGGAGDDTLLGSNGADVLLGGDNNDFIDGNQGNDVVFLGAGDDVFQWDPGDGNDTVEGQGGTDTLVFNGSNTNEIMDLSAIGSRLRLTRNIANIVMDVAGVETAQLNALGGTDTITVNDLAATELTALNLNLAASGGATNDAQFDAVIINGTPGDDHLTATQAGANASVAGLKTTITILVGDVTDALTINSQGGNDTVNASGMASAFALTIDGGPGKDTITGGSLADVLIGGDDDDTITGGQGGDGLYGGNGNDTFVWNPGDGSDIIEGQLGADKLLFNGSNTSENLDVSANGGRLRFFRDVANVVLDCDDVELLQVNSLGGADNLTMNELTSTDVQNVTVDLAATGGGGDAQADSIVINGTQTNDTITVTGSPGMLVVVGLSASVTVTNGEPANDSLTLNALAGLDTVDASGLAAGVIKLNLNGGLGDDVLIGSQGADAFTGGDGNDVIFGGDGDDTLVWNPGDDNDTFEGQGGSDTLQFNGANVAENIDISANGGRLRFFRNVANVVMDGNGVETVRFEALGGADVIVVNDLSATAVTTVNLNLAATGGVGDAQADSVIINGTSANDSLTVAQASGVVTVAGLPATVTISGSEAANDRVTINTLAGDDVVDASALAAGFINLTADGGIDDDVLTGSAGADILLGGDGDDVLIGGPGVDVLDGGPGNNIVIP